MDIYIVYDENEFEHRFVKNRFPPTTVDFIAREVLDTIDYVYAPGHISITNPSV